MACLHSFPTVLSISAFTTLHHVLSLSQEYQVDINSTSTLTIHGYRILIDDFQIHSANSNEDYYKFCSSRDFGTWQPSAEDDRGVLSAMYIHTYAMAQFGSGMFLRRLLVYTHGVLDSPELPGFVLDSWARSTGSRLRRPESDHRRTGYQPTAQCTPTDGGHFTPHSQAQAPKFDYTYTTCAWTGGRHDNSIIHHAPFPTPSPTSSAILFSTPRTPRPPQTPDFQIPDSGRSAVGGGHSFVGVIARKHVLVREGATHVSQYGMSSHHHKLIMFTLQVYCSSSVDEDAMSRVQVRVLFTIHFLSVCRYLVKASHSHTIKVTFDGCSWNAFFPSFPLSALRRLSLAYKTSVRIPLKLMTGTHYIPTMVMWSTDCVSWYCLLGF
ncbi:hypothetical protein V8F06_004670 [Rhypophila decipiens]